MRGDRFQHHACDLMSRVVQSKMVRDFIFFIPLYADRQVYVQKPLLLLYDLAVDPAQDWLKKTQEDADIHPLQL